MLADRPGMRPTPLLALALLAGCNAAGLVNDDVTIAIDMARSDGAIDLLARPDLADGGVDLTTPTPSYAGPCAPAQVGFGGALCGPPTHPCKLLRDELLPTPASFRNGAPEIAVDGKGRPHVMLENATGSYTSFLAVRDSGKWSIDPTPVGSALGLLALAPDGSDETLQYDGAFNLYYVRRGPSGWSVPARFAGMEDIAWPHALAADSAGCLSGVALLDHRAAFITRSPSSTAWASEALLPASWATFDSQWARLALAPSGRPGIAVWTMTGNVAQLAWVAPPYVPEIIASPSLPPTSAELGLAITGGNGDEGTPSVAFLDGNGALVLATRASGAWSTTTLAPGGGLVGDACGGPPQMPGQTCTTDWTTNHPIAVVASAGGDVRVLVSSLHHVDTLTSQCFGGGRDGADMGEGPPGCQWAQTSSTLDGRLTVYWQGAAGPAHADVGQIAGSAGAAAVDASGNVHVVTYDAAPNSGSDTVVHYVELGP